MSQYPQGSGPYQSQPYSSQYPYQRYGAYSNTGYAQQQQPPPADGHYTASQASFNYNASINAGVIPGLGITGNPISGLLYQAPANEQWRQGGYGSSPFPGVAPPRSTYPAPAPTSPVNAPLPAAQSYAPGPPKPDTPPKAQEEHAREDTTEEGELSEGEFDDLYEPRDETTIEGSAAAPKPPIPVESAESRGESDTDAQEPNFYDTEAEEIPGNQGQTEGRERTGSYSPYLSPREIQQDDLTPDISASHRPNGDQIRQAATSSDPRKPQETKQNGAKSGQDQESSTLGDTPGVPQSLPPIFKSLPEARKGAQKAILRLLPHGVKYQTYLDEGFDEKVVKGLFTDLNLVPPSVAASSGQRSTAQPPKDKQPQSAQASKAPKADAAEKTGEERKDRIARLLAEKAAKAAAGGGNSESTSKSKPSETASAAPAATASASLTKLEKDRLLQQKLEALKKSREARAQEAGRKTTSTQASQPGASQTSPATQESPAATGQLPASTVPTPYSGALHSFSRDDHLSAGHSQTASAAQGFASPASLSSLRSTPQIVQRKRPVASDFVDYPASSVKRPFLSARQNSSLIIQLSDDSDEDEDEDVDMEVDSADEDSSASVQEVAAPPHRGPSLRDYPPLTDKQRRHQGSSPANGSHQPPHTSTGRSMETEYEATMKKIAEYKKIIVAKEAKIKAKQGSTTPQTSSGGNATPTEPTEPHPAEAPPHRVVSMPSDIGVDGPSAQLLRESQTVKLPKRPQVSAAGSDSKSERRLRISSVQLPRVEATLHEKRTKAKLLQDQLRRLQAEIDEGLAEKQRLDDEMAELATESTQSTPQIGGPEHSEDTSKEASAAEPDHAESVIPGENPVQSPVVEEEEPNKTAEQPAPSSSGPAGVVQQQSQPMDIDSSPDKSDDQVEERPAAAEPKVDVPMAIPEEPTTVSEDLVQDDTTSHSLEEPGEVSEPAVVDTVGHEVAPTEPTGHQADATDGNGSDSYEPPEANVPRAVNSNHVVLPPSEPSLEGDKPEAGAVPTPWPTQISTAVVPANDPAIEQHAETVEAAREGDDAPAPRQQTTFVPYKSPLRYFHTYRFHPDYDASVSGGLKSLTYSNRIDPKKEVCPDELEGHACPRGDSCEFQHFRTMVAPDDQIILELGNSDPYTGEQKNKFNAGLRQLLASFRSAKIRDFRTIAQGVVDFRRDFLGDSSKVLNLGGVTI